MHKGASMGCCGGRIEKTGYHGNIEEAVYLAEQHGQAAPANPSTDGSHQELPEEWKMVPGWGDKYRVNNHGRIQSKASGNWKEMTLTIKDTGYKNASLRHDGKQKKVTIHILVAMLFLGERPNGLVINHIDGNKLNNCVWNLEYVTAAENNRHAQMMGLNCTKEEMNPMAKLNKSQVEEILQSTEPQFVIAKRMNVCQQTISLIRSGKRWKGLSPESWATPRSGKTTDENPETWALRQAKGDVATMPLTAQVKMWRTPSVAEEKNQNTSTQIYLQNQVGATPKAWATPIMGDSHLESTPEVAQKRIEEGKVTLSRQNPGKLNPRWVSVLMNLPVFWVKT
jgi:hypothetical protein